MKCVLSPQSIGHPDKQPDTLMFLLLLNLCIFGLLFCLVIMPFDVAIFFYNRMPFDQNICKFLGYFQTWIMYGERASLAIIAINSSIALNWDTSTSGYYKMINIMIPWTLPVFYLALLLLPTLPLDQTVGFVYNPDHGECTLSSKKLILVLDILGTYIPFIIIVSFYFGLHHMLCFKRNKMRGFINDGYELSKHFILQLTLFV